MDDNSPERAAQRTGATRRAIIHRLGGASLAAITVGSARIVPGVAAQAAPPINGEFIGTAPPAYGHEHDDDVFVAIVATGVGAERQVRAYLCDGQPGGIVEWFVGPIDGNAIALDSDDGDARIEAEISDAAVSGWYRLSGGEDVEFSAARPAGRGGLYRMYLRDGNHGFGVSASGVVLDVELVAGNGGGNMGYGRGTLLFPDGTVEDFDLPANGDVVSSDSGNFRIIVQDSPDGHMRGNSVKRTPTGQSDFSWSMCLD